MRRSRAGFTLVEALMTCVIFTAFIVSLSYFLIDTLKAQLTVSTQYGMQVNGRLGFDQILNDIRASKSVLSSYTVGQTTYTTDGFTTLVLSAPANDSSYAPLGTFDTIVYQLTGASAPYTINRFVFPAAGSMRSSVQGQPIISNVTGMQINYLVDQTVTGDGSTTAFTLNGAPSSASVTVIENGNTLPFGAGTGQAYYTPPTTLTFGSAPTATDVIDISYLVNSAGASAVTAVDVNVQMQVAASAIGDGIASQVLNLDSKACLINH